MKKEKKQPLWPIINYYLKCLSVFIIGHEAHSGAPQPKRHPKGRAQGKSEGRDEGALPRTEGETVE